MGFEDDGGRNNRRRSSSKKSNGFIHGETSVDNDAFGEKLKEESIVVIQVVALLV